MKKKNPPTDCFVVVTSPATGEELDRQAFYLRADGEAFVKEMAAKGFDANLIPLR